MNPTKSRSRRNATSAADAPQAATPRLTSSDLPPLTQAQLRYAATLTPPERREYLSRVRETHRLLASDEGRALAAIAELAKSLDDRVDLFLKVYAGSRAVPAEAWAMLEEMNRHLGGHTELRDLVCPHTVS